MQQIKCPNCGEAFTINESDYNSIISQIKDQQFMEEINRRAREIESRMRSEMELELNKARTSGQNALSERNKEIETLNHKLSLLESQYNAKLAQELSRKNSEMEKAVSDTKDIIRQRDSQIAALNAQLRNAEEVKNNAVSLSQANSSRELERRLSEKEKELAEVRSQNQMAVQNLQAQMEALRLQMQNALSEKESAVKAAEATKEKEASVKLASYEQQILTLKNEVQNSRTAADASLAKAEAEKKMAVAELENRLNAKETEKQLAVQTAVSAVKEDAEKKMDALVTDYTGKLENARTELALAHQEVEQLKNFKAKLSTKMIGESLEQHCSIEFNRNRMGMFPKAYFEKDNDARSGSKGDFIFRDYDDEGAEYISIMFEMKNEADTTATKHRNEDFFKELDKDRREKGCEYAILVSMLEADNDLYNEGIVDVSYRYPKMYVIRPQFFIPIITLLKNAAQNSIQYRKQLELEKRNNLDVTNFEANMNAFKDAFSRNYDLASRHFADAIKEIDESIKHLQKIKEAMTKSENQMRLANNKAQDLTIKKLTKNAPSVAAKIEEARNHPQNS